MLDNALCGIDEAGRGAIAGPLAVAGVILTQRIPALTDSKQLSAAAREKLYDDILRSKAMFHCVHLPAQMVDAMGLSYCMHYALQCIVNNMPGQSFLFDGNTTFGVSALKTQIKADLHVPQVSAASIIAKVSRDRLMYALHQQLPHYEFAAHKGYGTKKHVNLIRQYGYCMQHRKSFRIKALQPTLF